VQELNLVTFSCGKKRARTTSPAAARTDDLAVPGASAGDFPAAKRRRTTLDDVEPSHSSCGSDLDTSDGDVDYRHKKAMSADIFRYFVQADDAQQQDMSVMVSSSFQETWQSLIAQDPNIKLDDLGDALLHALTDVLCSGSKYRQLVPSSVSLHNNRTVVVTITRDYTYWAVIHCTWNTFELEDVGYSVTMLRSKFFKSQLTVEDIKQTLLQHLQTAMTDPSGADTYRPVEVIRMVVKQMKAFKDFSREHAGALTLSTAQALRDICDEAAGASKELCQQNDKVQGSVYIQRQLVTGHKFQVISSTGKLTNAMLCCPNWMHENAKEFVDKRKAFMDEKTKLRFFLRLQSLAESSENRLEHLVLSERARVKLTEPALYGVDSSIKCVLAYLILIGVNKNAQCVKAVAANYRRPPVSKVTRKNIQPSGEVGTDGAGEVEVDTEPVASTSSYSQ